MDSSSLRGLRVVLLAGVLVVAQGCDVARSESVLPRPAQDIAASSAATQTAVFAGGCFWGVEAVFRHTKGVKSAVSGYAGGPAAAATYEAVSSGHTGHAESVQVTYDPAQVSYGTLLQIFFAVAHDPTELNRQGPDVGTQYRSAIFSVDEEQGRVARAYIAQLDAGKAYPRPIVTQVTPLAKFYPAEAYHQDYLARHPDQPYIVYNDLPKLASLQRQYPSWYVGKAPPRP
jgi:peptide-methionine (S)-S-oxide reductase